MSVVIFIWREIGASRVTMEADAWMGQSPVARSLMTANAPTAAITINAAQR
jgi:hypothetical protein